MGGKAGRSGTSTSTATPPLPIPAASLLTFTKVLPTPPATPCTPEDILLGPPVDPKLRIKGYSDEEFENLVREWAYLYQQLQKGKYVQVGKFGGAGDMGRDVVGYIDPPGTPNGRLDIFQCKHYDHALYPGDVWAEIGKLCYHTFMKAFAVPEQYRLVAPEDVGADLGRYIEKPETLRDRLISVWEEHVSKKISGKQVKLEGELLAYVQAFDFSRIGCKPMSEILEEHKNTNRHAPRFGGGLRILRHPDMVPPEAIGKDEQRYVEQLIEAYRDHKDDSVTLDTVVGHPEFYKHFCRSREQFFCAETLRLDVRDGLPDGVTFEQAQTDVFDTVILIADDSHDSGFVRVKKVVIHSVHTKTDHTLKIYLKSKILQGICHQLANTNKLNWVPE